MIGKAWTSAVLLAGILLSGATALAQDAPDEATVPGELKVKMNAEYARLTVDGEEWSEHEFSGDGRTIFVKELDRSKDHTIRLEATTGGLKPVEFVVTGRDYKKARQKDKTFHFVASRTVKFEKDDRPKEPAPAPAPDPGAGDEPIE